MGKKYFIARMFGYSYITGTLVTALYAYQHLSAYEISLLASFGSIISTLLTLPVGAVAEKIGSKRVMVLATFVLMLGELTRIFANNVWLFGLSIVFINSGETLFTVSIPAYIQQYLHKHGKPSDLVAIDSFMLRWKIIKDILFTLVFIWLVRYNIHYPFIVSTVLLGMGLPFCMSIKDVGEKVTNEHSIMKILYDSRKILKPRLVTVICANTLSSIISRTLYLYQFLILAEAGVAITYQLVIVIGTKLVESIGFKYSELYIQKTRGSTLTVVVLMQMIPALILLLANKNMVWTIIAYIPLAIFGTFNDMATRKYINKEAGVKHASSGMSLMIFIKGIVYIIVAPIFGAIYTKYGQDCLLGSLLIFTVLGLSLVVVFMNKLFDNGEDTKEDNQELNETINKLGEIEDGKEA